MEVTYADSPPKRGRPPKAPAPTYPGLRIDGPANPKKIAPLYQAAAKFQTRLDAVMAQRAKLLEQGHNLKVSAVIKTAGELLAEKNSLEEELRKLRWQRFELLPDLAADFNEAVEAAKRDHEKAAAAVRKDFASRGLTSDTMGPGGGTGERLLVARIEAEPECLAALGRIRQAKGAVNGLKAQTIAFPKESECVINWPAARGEQKIIADLGAI